MLMSLVKTAVTEASRQKYDRRSENLSLILVLYQENSNLESVLRQGLENKYKNALPAETPDSTFGTCPHLVTCVAYVTY